jgi:hypothetical protein
VAESGIILPTDSTGKATRTETVTTTFVTGSGGVVHMPVQVIGDPTTIANLMAVGANGQVFIQGYQPSASTFSGITATGAQTSVACTAYNIATVTLRTFTGTTPSVTWSLQASDDGGTNWTTLQGINNNTGQIGTSWTQGAALTAGTAGPSCDYAIGAYTHLRINVSAISGTSATAAFGLAMQSMSYEPSPGTVDQGSTAPGATLVGNPVPTAGTDSGGLVRTVRTDGSGNVGSAPVDGYKATYVASVSAMSTTIASDVFVLTGSATKTIRVTRVEVYCVSGAATTTTWQLIKRSTVDTAGTTSAATVIAIDSSNAAASATATGYTVAPTLGTSVGPVRTWRGSVATTGTGVTWDFGGGRPVAVPRLAWYLAAVVRQQRNRHRHVRLVEHHH